MFESAWKKVLCVVFALVIMISSTSCIIENSSGQVPKADDGKNQDSSAGRGEKLTIDWLTYQYGNVDENAPTKLKLEEMFNVKFNIWYIDVNKRDEVLGARLASGQIPDFMTVYSDNDMLKFSKQQLTQVISEEEVEKYLPNWKKYVDSYSPKLWTYASAESGQYMGIPNVNMDGIYSKPVVWRQDWLEKVGIKNIPATLSEFEEAVYKFRNDDPDGNGKKDTYGLSGSALMNIFGAFGVGQQSSWGKKDGKLLPYCLFPECKDALELLRRWKKDEVIDPEWIIGENKGGYWALSHAFINGKIGVSSHGENYHWTPKLYEGAWEGQNVTQFNLMTGGKGKIAFGPPPKGPGGKYGNVINGLKSSTYMAIGKNADAVKKQRILTIWDTIYSDFDLWKFVRYGEENIHYDVKSDGVTIEMKKGFSNPDEMARYGAHITFVPFGKWDFLGRVTRPESTEFNQKNFIWQEAGYENYLKVALPSEMKYVKNLEQLTNEAFAAIINGEKDISYFDTFVEEYMKSGGEQLIQEANEWYGSLPK